MIAKTFTEAIHQAVAQRGRDYIYRPPGGQGLSCLYVHVDAGEPGCLIGLALTLMGVGLEDLAGQEGENAQDALSALTDASWRARAAALAAQEAQDIGRTWGDALDTYNRSLES